MDCLIKYRKGQGLSKVAMASKLEISLSLYDKLENGDRKPSRRFMEKFKRTFPSFDMNIFFDEELHGTCRAKEV